jgi:hypothetical protein
MRSKPPGIKPTDIKLLPLLLTTKLSKYRDEALKQLEDSVASGKLLNWAHDKHHKDYLGKLIWKVPARKHNSAHAQAPCIHTIHHQNQQPNTHLCRFVCLMVATARRSQLTTAHMTTCPKRSVLPGVQTCSSHRYRRSSRSSAKGS